MTTEKKFKSNEAEKRTEYQTPHQVRTKLVKHSLSPTILSP